MTIKPTLVALLALTCAPALVAQTEINDKIATTSGKRIRGAEVIEMTAVVIKYKKDGDEYELPATSLADIDWHEPPEPMLLARAAEKNSQYANAANLYEEAAKKTDRPVLAREARFLAARAMVRAAESDASRAPQAVAKLSEFLAEAPDTYRAAEARLELGRAQLLAGDPSAAEQTLQELGNMIVAQSLDPLWDVRAKFAIAQAQLAQGKLPEARASFRRVKSTAESALATSAGPNPEIEAMIAEAVVGEGETFISEENYDEAIRYFERFERDGNQSIAAAALAGKGEALILRAEKTGKTDDLRVAQIALAEANVLDPLAGATTAKALYYSGKVILALGPDRESQDFATRANSYFEAAAKYYPDTRWAAKAAAEIK